MVSILRLRHRSISRHPVSPANRFLQCMALAALIVLCVGARVQANGVDTEGFLHNLEEKRQKAGTYSARFVQKKTLTLFDQNKISSGVVFYKAPRRMIWKYEEPDKTQMRIDGASVSFYFPELEQIEIYDLKDSSGASYFFFAFEASADELRKNFDISIGAASDENISQVRLLPKSEPIVSQLRDITLWLRKSDYLPQRILINEASGDTTAIELSDIRVNEPVADDELELDAPEGTEIIRSDTGAF